MIYKYKSPYRPLPFNYLPKDVKFLYDFSTIGQWSRDTIYAFDKPIPENLISNWELEVLEGNQFQNDICKICFHKTQSQIDGEYYCSEKGIPIKDNLKDCEDYLDGRED